MYVESFKIGLQNIQYISELIGLTDISDITVNSMSLYVRYMREILLKNHFPLLYNCLTCTPPNSKDSLIRPLRAGYANAHGSRQVRRCNRPRVA